MKSIKQMLAGILAAALCLPMIPAQSVHAAQTASVIKLGDVDGKPGITLTDAQLILKFALRIQTPDKNQEKIADMNQDKKVTLTDAQLCLKYALRILNPNDVPVLTAPPETEKPSTTEPVPPSVSETPAPSQPAAPSETPGATGEIHTTKPADPTDTPDVTESPVPDTTAITLYNGNNTTGSACATVTIANTEGITSANELSTSFGNSQKIWWQETGRYTYLDEEFIHISNPVITSKTITWQVSIKEEAMGTISGTGAIFFTTGTDYTNFKHHRVDVTIWLDTTITKKYPIMNEDFINVGMVSADAVYSDPNVCTTDASIIINNRHDGIDISKVVQDGTTWVSGPCVITEEENNPEKYYRISHKKEIAEVYLEPKGVYDEEMTKAVEEELKKNTNWYWDLDTVPKEYYEFLYNTIDSWYKGEISYRCLKNTLVYTQFYEDNRPQNPAGILNGEQPQYFGFSTFSGNGRGQDCKIYIINGTINVDTVWQTIYKLGQGGGTDDSYIGYVRVHYDSKTDLSYVYYIS